MKAKIEKFINRYINLKYPYFKELDPVITDEGIESITIDPNKCLFVSDSYDDKYAKFIHYDLVNSLVYIRKILALKNYKITIETPGVNRYDYFEIILNKLKEECNKNEQYKLKFEQLYNDISTYEFSIRKSINLQSPVSLFTLITYSVYFDVEREGDLERYENMFYYLVLDDLDPHNMISVLTYFK